MNALVRRDVRLNMVWYGGGCWEEKERSGSDNKFECAGVVRASLCE